MKPRISPEVDRLMWLVVENGDAKAIDDFGQRFPDLRGELGKRLDMIRSLRGAKENSTRAIPIPEFTPRNQPVPPPSRRLVWVAAAVCLAALGLATYVAVQGGSTSSHKTPQIEQIPTDMPTPTSDVHHADRLPEPTPAPTSVPTPAIAPPTPLAPEYTPQNFAFHNTKLSVAVSMTAKAGNYVADFAPPGLPDIEINDSFPDMTPNEVLKALAAEYGFSVFKEEPGVILVIPAKDKAIPTPEKSQTPSTEPSPRAGVR